MTDNVERRKRELRASVLARRCAMNAATRAAAGQAIATLGHAAWSGSGCVAAYLAVGHEPATAALLDLLRVTGTAVLLPVIDGDELDWAEYDGAGSLAPGPLGISEPTGQRRGPSGLAHAEVIVVPALAVDRHGHRLGRGRGFYDRALANVTVPVVAAVYDHELIDDVPTQCHDRTVTKVLRPSGLIDCESAG